MPKPLPPPPVPTTDQAQEQADADLAAAKRRGAMADIFSPTTTGQALGAPPPESTLRRTLG
jgi:hypothetical protein